MRSNKRALILNCLDPAAMLLSRHGLLFCQLTLPPVFPQRVFASLRLQPAALLLSAVLLGLLSLLLQELQLSSFISRALRRCAHGPLLEQLCQLAALGLELRL